MTNSDSLTAPLVSRPAVPARPARNPAARNPAARNRAARTPARGHTAWLGLAVVASLTAAAVHVWVLPDHVRESYLYGAFFAGAASGQLLFAVLLARRPGRLLLRTGAWASGAVVLLWLYTRTAGVPVGPGAGGVEPVGVQDALATAAEVLTVLSCAACLRLPGGVGPLRWRPGPLRCAGERPGARTPTPAWRGPSEEATCR